MAIYKKEATQEEMKREAVLRMNLLKLDATTIRSFQSEGMVSLSEQIGQQVILLAADEEANEKIRRFEKEYEALVYHVLRSQNPMVGDCWSLLFVSPESSGWKNEREYIESSKLVYAYSESELEEGVSEIMAEPREGGLVRLA